MQPKRRITRLQMRTLDKALAMEQGYVLDFSNRTMAEFFEDEFGLDLEMAEYCVEGNSKARRLRRFLEIAPSHLVARVLRSLWEYRTNLNSFFQGDGEQEANLRTSYFKIVEQVETHEDTVGTDALVKFSDEETLDRLIASIERDIDANEPGTALDRLHTYCMKKLRYLLSQRNIPCDENDALHSRAGKYRKCLADEGKLNGLSQQIIVSTISVFEKFNKVRNDHSLAHDNDLVAPSEAKFIFEGISAFLRFIRTIDAEHFDG